jgi:hypothetical protein
MDKEMTDHCKPGDDCHCSEKIEKTIEELFYAKHSQHYVQCRCEFSGRYLRIHYNHRYTDVNRIASLDDDGNLVVEKE